MIKYVAHRRWLDLCGRRCREAGGVALPDVQGGDRGAVGENPARHRHPRGPRPAMAHRIGLAPMAARTDTETALSDLTAAPLGGSVETPPTRGLRRGAMNIRLPSRPAIPIEA